MIAYIKALILLFITFAKLALFNFGGGFVMITLIQDEIVKYGWLSIEEFSNVIAISQMTPGAVAINTATYIGYQVAGILGAIITSLAIPVPSFFIVLLISPILLKYKDHGLHKMIFYGIRAVVVGLILNAAIVVAKTPFFKENWLQIKQIYASTSLPKWMQNVNLGSIAIFVVSLVLIVKYKWNPILVILLAGGLGILVFSVLPLIF